MTAELFASLCLFAFVTSITPGPNNAMLFASGVNFGVRRTLPHLLGVSLGYTFMQLAIGLGLGAALTALPGLYTAVRVAGAGYMLYLAWRIGTSTPPAEAAAQTQPQARRASARPMTFLEATAFQWVNPKALMMCVTAAGTYAQRDNPVAGVLFICAAYLLVNFPCVGAWVLLGRSMRGLLQDRRRLAVFNWGMAVLLVASMAPLAGELLPAGIPGIGG